MYILFGIEESVCQSEIGGDFEYIYEKTDALASFSSIELLEAYVKENKLNKPKSTGTYSGRVSFSSKSLLSGCFDYEYFDVSGIPVDP